MPCKIRELKARLLKSGFKYRPGKGSHTVWEYPGMPQTKFTLSGNDGADAQPYQVQRVNAVITKSKENRRE